MTLTGALCAGRSWLSPAGETACEHRAMNPELGEDNWSQDTTTRVGPGRTVLEHQPGASPTDKDTTDS